MKLRLASPPHVVDIDGIPGLAYIREAVRIETKDPICGMIVDAATARFQSEFAGRAVSFCCHHGKEMFDRDPERYRAAL